MNEKNETSKHHDAAIQQNRRVFLVKALAWIFEISFPTSMAEKNAFAMPERTRTFHNRRVAH
jgi:hypothetical protein